MAKNSAPANLNLKFSKTNSSETQTNKHVLRRDVNYVSPDNLLYNFPQSSCWTKSNSRELFSNCDIPDNNSTLSDDSNNLTNKNENSSPYAFTIPTSAMAIHRNHHLVDPNNDRSCASAR